MVQCRQGPRFVADAVPGALATAYRCAARRTLPSIKAPALVTLLVLAVSFAVLVATSEAIEALKAVEEPDIVVAALPSKDDISIAPEKDPVKLAPAPVKLPASVIVGEVIVGFCIFMSQIICTFIAVFYKYRVLKLNYAIAQ